ncbi:MAG: helix-turn-helix transcriptional regulator [Euzebyales bacterium]|nr:helix-turn-helix transcriptional regulator [Euzebyales bacterium]
MDAGALLSEARRRAGLSQRRLAVLAGTSQAAVHRYEHNLASPSVATLTRLVTACGVRLHVQLSQATTNIDLSELAAIEYMLARTPEQRLSDLRVSDAFSKSAHRVC